jgi:hypothetical protein
VVGVGGALVTSGVLAVQAPRSRDKTRPIERSSTKLSFFIIISS